MISPGWLLFIYCVLVVLASLAGGLLPLLVRLTHTRIQLATSLVAGLMLGIALLHFLPHGAEQLGSLHRTVAWVLGGFLAMFFLQRFFHFHHHDLPEGDPDDCCQHGEHDHGGQGHVHHEQTLAAKSAKQLTWVGTAVGLTLHSLLDGLALAAAVLAGACAEHEVTGLAGAGVALAVILHKPFDALAIGTLMTVGGHSRFSRHVLNGLFALATPIGAGLFLVGMSQFAENNPAFLGCALAFCAGAFLCIACSDLLPELQFHSHDTIKLSIALLLGIGVAILIGQFEHCHEAGHDHVHRHDPAQCADPGHRH